MTAKNNSSASSREQKATKLDLFVKAELAKERATDAAKISKLRALRLARDAQQPAQIASGKRPKSKALRKAPPSLPGR
jgi:hypothetical protein